METYQAVVCSTISERGLQLDHKIRIINAIGNAAVSYRTRLMHAYNNRWLQDLDVWVVKSLNKLGRLAPQTDKAYWYSHRGLKNLFCENNATYIQHSVDKILNDPLHTLSVKAYTTRHLMRNTPRLKLQLLSGISNEVSTQFKDTKITAALHKADIRWMEQLLLDGYPITTKQFDKLNIDTPTDAYLTDKYDGWGKGVAATVRKWFLKRPTLAIPQATQIEQEVVNVYTDGSKKK